MTPAILLPDAVDSGSFAALMGLVFREMYFGEVRGLPEATATVSRALMFRTPLQHALWRAAK